MTKSKENSHFELIRGDRLPEYGNRIVQIDSNKQYTNHDLGVYMCEVADEEVNNEH